MKRLTALALPAVLTLFTGCDKQEVELGGRYQAVVDVEPEPIRDLDILFVIDNSGSMQPHQEALAAAAGDALFAQLEADLGALPDLHMAFVSTNVGTGPEGGGGTACNGNGDDGLFRGPEPGSDACQVTAEAFLKNLDDGAGGRMVNYQGTLAEAFSCMAIIGTLGCGFEQPIEAIRRALDGRHPENDGFLRDEAMLLIVILADEDDCSAFDRTVFDPDQDSIDAPLGIFASYRCFEFGVVCDDDAPRTPGLKSGCQPREDSRYLASIAQSAEAIAALKPDPTRIMVAGLFGDVGPAEVVSGERDELELRDVCGRGTSSLVQDTVWPAIRLHALTEHFPSRYAFGSICDATMATPLRSISRHTAGVMDQRPCLTAEVDLRGEEGPRCRVFDVTGPRTATEVRIELHACADDSTRPCYEIAKDAELCSYTPGSLAVRVSRSGSRPPGAHLVAECVMPAKP